MVYRIERKHHGALLKVAWFEWKLLRAVVLRFTRGGIIMLLDPRLLALFGVLFLGLGIFNLVLGRKRLMQIRAHGQKVAWYKQMAILTGIEYLMLAVVLLLHLGIMTNFFPNPINGIALLLYIATLIIAALILFAMLYVSIRSSSLRIRAGTSAAATTRVAAPEKDTPSSERQAEQAQKRRERRQKAAEARRRRAGRA